MAHAALILVNYNTAVHTLEAVAALQAQGLPLEIIVVDNASHAEERRRLGALTPDVHVVWSETNLGYGGAINRAVPLTEAPVVGQERREDVADRGFAVLPRELATHRADAVDHRPGVVEAGGMGADDRRAVVEGAGPGNPRRRGGAERASEERPAPDGMAGVRVKRRRAHGSASAWLGDSNWLSPPARVGGTIPSRRHCFGNLPGCHSAFRWFLSSRRALFSSGPGGPPDEAGSTAGDSPPRGVDGPETAPPPRRTTISPPGPASVTRSGCTAVRRYAPIDSPTRTNRALVCPGSWRKAIPLPPATTTPARRNCPAGGAAPA